MWNNNNYDVYIREYCTTKTVNTAIYVKNKARLNLDDVRIV